ncbi:MAG TPA: AmpG family muropeptide MFS transporter [Bdellovibrionota bacterium]|nr:AmpG family muropeptide MFS transporter [Bdellovibrionota bacterium]
MDAIVRLFTNWRMLAILCMGFASGLPLALTASGGTIQAWMTRSGLDLATIGRFALVGLPYILKFLWAPFLDSYAPPFLGRRRGWALVTQAALICSLVLVAFSDPVGNFWLFTLLAVLVAICSASQDIVLDAFRTELLKPEEMGFGASVYVAGYRLGMIVSGAFALSMAKHTSYNTAYLAMAVCALVGPLTVLLTPEPKVEIRFKAIASIKERVLLPFAEFFKRQGAMEIILFVMLYKLPTMMATALTTSFLIKMNFDEDQIASASKLFGVAATIVGALTGGVLMTKLGTKRSLWIFGLLQAVGGLAFIIVTILKPETDVVLRLAVMTMVVVVENFMIGLGVAAISGFMMSVCSKQFTGTQFALLSSLAAVARVILVSPAGKVADAIGWPLFYVFSVSLAVPGLFLLTRYDSWEKNASAVASTREISRTDFSIMGLFMAALIVITTEGLWKKIGLPDVGGWVGSALLVASLSLWFFKGRHLGKVVPRGA